MQDTIIGGSEYRSELETSFHKTIKKVTEDIELLKFNTAIAALMTLLNEINQVGNINRCEMKTFLILLNPFAPHITEELWQALGFPNMVSKQKWPQYIEEKTKENTIEIAIQINGKLRGTVEIKAGSDKDMALSAAKQNESISAAIEGKTIVKEIYVPERLVNIVIK